MNLFKRFRSARTGRYVTSAEAEANKDTTISEPYWQAMTWLIQRVLWHWLGAYTVDQAMLDGMLAAIEEEAARTPKP